MKNKLTTRGIDAAIKRGDRGKLSDGDGLVLNIDKYGARWTLHYTSPVSGKRREMGIGKLSVVGLADARRLADEARGEVASGRDPLNERKLARATALTFGQCADDTLKVARQEWSTKDAVPRWERAMQSCATIWNDPIKDMSPSVVAGILESIEAPTQRRFVQLCLRRVFDTAIARGSYTSHNPADARIIGKLVTLKHKGGHNKALHWRDVPKFVRTLRDGPGSARALEFIIRTGVRKREAIEAQWCEFDLDRAVWTIPAERTKVRREHVVPLSERAIEILRQQRAICDGGMSGSKIVEKRVTDDAGASAHPFAGDRRYVFPGGGKKAVHLSHGAFIHLLKDGITVHGFRASLRTYLGDKTNVGFETAEDVLGHKVGDATVRAYRREGDLERRREALQLWNDHIDGLHETINDSENVLQFKQIR